MNRQRDADRREDLGTISLYNAAGRLHALADVVAKL